MRSLASEWWMFAGGFVFVIFLMAEGLRRWWKTRDSGYLFGFLGAFMLFLALLGSLVWSLILFNCGVNSRHNWYTENF
jgi:predicted tellurium resistance membrane protein TerC